jgi:predicted RecB family nuclease
MVKAIIYEATFEYNGLLSAIDILVKDNNQWKAYEVKSSTSVSETYIIDAAVQYYTIVNSGLKLSDISIVLINSEYVRKGEINLNEFFNIISVKNEVLNQQRTLPDKIDFLKKIIHKNEIPYKKYWYSL